jgi:hypothetical protein
MQILNEIPKSVLFFGSCDLGFVILFFGSCDLFFGALPGSWIFYIKHLNNIR